MHLAITHKLWRTLLGTTAGRVILGIIIAFLIFCVSFGYRAVQRNLSPVSGNLPSTSKSASVASSDLTAEGTEKSDSKSDTSSSDKPAGTAAAGSAGAAQTGGTSGSGSSGGTSGDTGGGGGGTTPATCSSGTHTPGASDGVGGCWPGPNNTGVPAGVTLTSYSSPCTITIPNTVIDAKNILCDEILIRANNVTISRSRIKHAVHGMESLGYAFTISDSEIDGALADYGGVACVNCGVDGYDFTLVRSEVTHTNRGAYCSYRCTIQDTWIHGTNLDTSPCPQASSGTCPHASAIRAEQYANIKHTVLSCDFTGPFNDDLGCSADMSGYPDFAPITHNTIDGNLFMANNIGAGFCAYGGGTSSKPYSNDPTNATYIVFKNNVFQRGANGKCGTYGPVTDFIVGRTGNVWTNNKYDNGATVNPE